MISNKNKSLKKVLFDITVLGSGYSNACCRTGVFRVSEEALNALSKIEDLDLYFCASKGNADDCISYLKEYFPQYIEKFVMLKRYNFFKSLIQNFKKDYDYYFSPYFEIHKKYRNNLFTKKILIIYDLIQVMFPQWVRNDDTKGYKRFLKVLNKDVNCLCISECTKTDLMRYKPELDEKRVKTIPLGADTRYVDDLSEEKCKQILEKYNLKTPYFFSISSLNPRKNFRHTIKCFIDFIEKNNLTDVSLVLAGPDGWGELFDGINLEKYKKQIIFTGFVDEEDLPYLYKNAIASIYLSLYEGFGLPPLESIKTGTPVIASNVSSIPEVVPAECGGLLINPKDENALICMLQKLYFDENFRQEISIKGVEYAKTYTWEKFAQVLKKEFE